MLEIFTPHNEALMPIKTGSPYRVPKYAHGVWGLVYPGEDIVTAAYKAEWAGGTAAQLGLVSQATIEGGFGDYPELLRQKTGEIITSIARGRSDNLVLLDIGAGPGLSALAGFQALPSELQDQFRVILVEPSTEALKDAGSLMEKHSINYTPLHGSDLEMLKQIQPNSVDILIGVASVHHHAEIPFDQYASTLKPGGYAIFADWHHDLWEHPARTLKFLERFDWSLKKEGLDDWRKTYPQALEDPDKSLSLTPNDLAAREQITQFWLAYKRIADGANLGINAIWPLEGHRPVARYVEGLKGAGLKLRRLIKLLPDSSLLMITVAQKPKHYENKP